MDEDLIRVDEQGRKHYSIGTLTYTIGGVFRVSIIVLLAGFFYNMAGFVIVPTLLPLLMDKYGASSEFIAIVIGSIPAAINVILNPIVSTASDRTRSRFGRRMPFLMFATPFTVILLITLGWSPEIMGYLHPKFLSGYCNFNTAILAFLGFTTAIFIMFNYIIGSVYFYVAPDIIPHCFMGRYMSVLQIFTVGAGSLFNFLFLPYAREYSKWIYVIVAAMFSLSFLIMFVFVKEGNYSPVEQVNNLPLWKRFINSVKMYIKDCLSSKFFLALFIGVAINQVSTACRNLFNLLFAVKELNITEAQYGQILGVGAIVALGAVLITGYLGDRIMPLLIFMGTGILVIILNIIGYFLVVDFKTFYIVGILMVVIYSMQSVSIVLTFVALFPKEKYGQFCSANAMVTSIFMIIGNYFGGVVIGIYGYRFLFIWDTLFTLIATLLLVYIYVTWRKLSRGKSGYDSSNLI